MGAPSAFGRSAYPDLNSERPIHIHHKGVTITAVARGVGVRPRALGRDDHSGADRGPTVELRHHP
jgi:hypothetical protein